MRVVWQAFLAPSVIGCQAMPCVDAASCCVVGPGHEVACFRSLGGPWASAGSLVGGVRIPKTPRLLPVLHQVPELVPGVSSGMQSWLLKSG